jgi:thiamine biosynthesis lipoprotein ApbE
MEADALATTAYVMGPDKGYQFIKQFRGVEGLIIKNRRHKISSSGWKRS